jgi:hypothetical protein
MVMLFVKNCIVLRNVQEFVTRLRLISVRLPILGQLVLIFLSFARIKSDVVIASITHY